MMKENIYTLIALMIIFALGCAIATQEATAAAWFGFISAFGTLVLAATALLGLGTWKRQLHESSKIESIKKALPLAYKLKLISNGLVNAAPEIDTLDADHLRKLILDIKRFDEISDELIPIAASISDSERNQAENIEECSVDIRKNGVWFLEEITRDDNSSNQEEFTAVYNSLMKLAKGEFSHSAHRAKTHSANLYDSLINKLEKN